MLKHLILAISVSLLAIACGGPAEEPKTPADAPATDKPADTAAPADKPADAPAADAKPADPAAAPAPK